MCTGAPRVKRMSRTGLTRSKLQNHTSTIVFRNFAHTRTIQKPSTMCLCLHGVARPDCYVCSCAPCQRMLSFLHIHKHSSAKNLYTYLGNAKSMYVMRPGCGATVGRACVQETQKILSVVWAGSHVRKKSHCPSFKIQAQTCRWNNATVCWHMCGKQCCLLIGRAISRRLGTRLQIQYASWRAVA